MHAHVIVCVCTFCMYVHVVSLMHINRDMDMYTGIWICTSICICICMNFVCVSIDICTHREKTHTHIHIQIYIHTYIYICVYIHIYVCIYTYIYIYIYAYIHIYIVCVYIYISLHMYMNMYVIYALIHILCAYNCQDLLLLVGLVPYDGRTCYWCVRVCVRARVCACVIVRVSTRAHAYACGKLPSNHARTILRSNMHTFICLLGGVQCVYWGGGLRGGCNSRAIRQERYTRLHWHDFRKIPTRWPKSSGVTRGKGVRVFVRARAYASTCKFDHACTYWMQGPYSLQSVAQKIRNKFSSYMHNLFPPLLLSANSWHQPTRS